MTLNQDEPFKRLVEEIKRKVSAIEIREGKKPTFEDYVDEMIEEGTISMNNIEMQLRAHALGWSGAKLGKSNWKELHSKINIEISNTNVNCYEEEKKQKETTMKTNKTLNFFTSLGLEVDKEIIKGIKGIGVFKIILSVVGFLLLRYLVLYFGSDDNVFTFYFYSVIALLLLLVWYSSELKKVSKIKFLIDFGGQILMIVISLVIIFALLFGIIEIIIDAIMYVYNSIF